MGGAAGRRHDLDGQHVHPDRGSVATASTYMNYVYEPAVAAKIAAYVNYVTPVKGAKEELQKADPETADNTLIFPTSSCSRS